MPLVGNTQPQRISILQSFWLGGANSFVDPIVLPPTQYQQAFNVDNEGGSVRTRPRHALKNIFTTTAHGKRAQGLISFTPKNWPKPVFVVVTGGRPFIVDTAVIDPVTSGWKISPLPGFPTTDPPPFWPNAQRVSMAVGIKNVDQNIDGSLTVIDPYPILMIADGYGLVVAWDGGLDGKPARKLSPGASGYGPRAGASMLFWTNNRMAYAEGNYVHFSDIADPITFTEERVVAGGGFFNYPEPVTCINETPDKTRTIVTTASATYTLETSIRDRTQWPKTANFQTTIFQNIGCVGPKAFTNHFGVSWWYSDGGLVSLDAALNANRSSAIIYQDQPMKRSKADVRSSQRGICLGQFKNYLMCSVPSGDTTNRHTWLYNQNAGNGSAWAGIWTGLRPVEYARARIDGRLRTFFLSEDWNFDPNPANHISCRLWEAFADNVYEELSDRVFSSMETGFFFLDLRQPLSFVFAEIEMSEIRGAVDLRVSVAGKNGGGYREVMPYTRVNATPGPFSGSDSVAAYPPILGTGAYSDDRVQTRTVRTQTFAPLGKQNLSQCLEAAGFAPGTDRAFSIYLEWHGNAAIKSVRVFMDAKAENQDGRCQADEGNVFQPIPALTLAQEPPYDLR